MRYILMLTVLLMLGCAPSGQPVADSTATDDRPLSLADVAGTWEGTITAAGSEAVLVNLVVTASEDPAGWTMQVTNAADTKWTEVVPVTQVEAAGDSLIVETGTFPSVLRKGEQVRTHSIYRLDAGRLVGTHHATYPSTGETVLLSSVATRSAG